MVDESFPVCMFLDLHLPRPLIFSLCVNDVVISLIWSSEISQTTLVCFLFNSEQREEREVERRTFDSSKSRKKHFFHVIFVHWFESIVSVKLLKWGHSLFINTWCLLHRSSYWVAVWRLVEPFQRCFMLGSLGNCKAVELKYS